MRDEQETPSILRRPLTGRVVIATHNSGKLAEMRELLAPFRIEAISAGDMGLDEPAETGTSFGENARIKARAAALASALPAFADDSGLVVEALGGAPGIHSARWAGPDRNFSRAMTEIEDKLRARSRPKAAKRISSRRFVSPGPTGIWKNSKTASMGRWFGRRAATRDSATIRYFFPMATPAPSAR